MPINIARITPNMLRMRLISAHEPLFCGASGSSGSPMMIPGSSSPSCSVCSGASGISGSSSGSSGSGVGAGAGAGTVGAGIVGAGAGGGGVGCDVKKVTKRTVQNCHYS